MKRYLRFLPILLFCLISFTCPAQKTFADLAEIKGVSSVYIGKTMLKMASALNLSDLDVSGVDISKLVGELSSIEVISCDGKKLVKKVLPKSNKILKGIPFETISEVNKNGNEVDISGVFKDNSDIITTLLVKVLQADTQLTIVLMKGEIDLETLQSALKN